MRRKKYYFLVFLLFIVIISIIFGYKALLGNKIYLRTSAVNPSQPSIQKIIPQKYDKISKIESKRIRSEKNTPFNANQLSYVGRNFEIILKLNQISLEQEVRTDKLESAALTSDILKKQTEFVQKITQLGMVDNLLIIPPSYQLQARYPSYTYVVSFPNNVDKNKTVSELKRNSFVEYAYPNIYYHTAVISNDPYYLDPNPVVEERSLTIEDGGWDPKDPSGTLIDYQWSHKKTNVSAMWSQNLQKTIVAVIDTGVDYNHPDIKNSMWINADEIPNNKLDDDNNGYVDDIYGYDFVEYEYNKDAPNPIAPRISKPIDSDPMDDATELYFQLGYAEIAGGHGTFVAGIIGAQIGNNKGIAGVTPNSQIMAVRVLDALGSGSTSQILHGIRYAIENGAKVINMSFGQHNNYDPAFEELLQVAAQRGIILVAAAGNESNGGEIFSSIMFPARDPNTIAVGAFSYDLNRANYSSTGQELDILAPGGSSSTEAYNLEWYDMPEILSLRAAGTDMKYPDYNDNPDYNYATNSIKGKEKNYYISSGTSMAAPYISGIASMLIGLNPLLSSNKVKNAILNATDDKGKPGFDPIYGYGLINVDKLIKNPNYNTPAEKKGPIYIPPIKEKRSWHITLEGRCSNNQLANYSPRLLSPWTIIDSSWSLINWYEGKQWNQLGPAQFTKTVTVNDLSYVLVPFLSQENFLKVDEFGNEWVIFRPLSFLRSDRNSSAFKTVISDGVQKMWFRAQDLPSGDYIFTYQTPDEWCVSSPRTYKINTHLRCQNGKIPSIATTSEKTNIWYVVWPPNPYNPINKDLTLGLDQETNIISDNYANSIYVGLRRSDGGFLNLLDIMNYDRPREDRDMRIYYDVHYGTAFKPSTPLIYWQRSQVLDTPNYGLFGEKRHLYYSAPDEWCK